ncbi:ATP-dependent DNA helicase RecS [Mizuhopecten yessoensis]|uniref:DNA 3'-5' helicase n=2 Tax=Mizuhopecten yessoensis TaxID=6573 RepID=A0A210PFQ0_MIZYE|nr:ATP-dependent DNA helicase RecS [Mizuhopecten yessoensis]
MGDRDSKIIVCSPLVALMRDQCERLKNIPGIKAEYKCRSAEGDLNIEKGQFDYLYASPEALVGDKNWSYKLKEFSVSTIVVDEFHTISTWGENKEEDKKAFRKWFSYIGEVRSLFPDASMLAPSATCTKKISRRVSKVLQMDDDLVEIRISPNKPNIKLVVRKIPNTVEMSMVWMIDALCEETFPRTIVYCSTIKATANIYSYIVTEKPEAVSSVEMFHSETPDDKKQKVLESLKNPGSSLKLLVATSALGMGVDFVNVYNVIVYGAPKSLVDLIQEKGRVGRDGKDSVALLLVNSYHLRDVNTEVKDMFKTEECRRVAMLTPFLTELELTEIRKQKGLHSCCDLCAVSCSCSACTSSFIEKLIYFISADDADDKSSDEDTESSYTYDPFDYEDDLDLSLVPDLDLNVE